MKIKNPSQAFNHYWGLQEFQVRKNTLITYLKMKVAEGDWHAVADAAMDLRELEVEIKNAKSS